MVRRFDIGEIRFSELTDEGFLKANAVVTRTGILLYQNADGSIRRELRHPDDVFQKSSLDSLAMIPITNGHPPEGFVTADNSKKLQVGTTGQEITPDGKFVKSSLIINDGVAVQAVKMGKRELSLGYSLDLVMEPGVYDGEHFDARQTNIRYNHLALVEQARAGSNARISLDSTDAIQTNVALPRKQEEIRMDSKLIQVNLDNINYDASPEVANALTKANASLATMKANLDTLTAEKTTLQANFDTTKDKLAKAEAVDIGKMVADGVKDRMALVEQAIPHLDEEVKKTVSSLSNKDLKLAVIKAHTEANMDGKDDAYINARYDSYIEAGVKTPENSGIAGQRQQVNTDDKGGAVMNADQARAQMIKNQQEAYKKTPAKA